MLRSNVEFYVNDISSTEAPTVGRYRISARRLNENYGYHFLESSNLEVYNITPRPIEAAWGGNYAAEDDIIITTHRIIEEHQHVEPTVKN